jgi:uncharacterized protein (TIGR02453 family)
MKKTFPGFSREGLKFLRDLKKNNDREWFTPRKATFEDHLRLPMIELITAVQGEMAGFAPHYGTDPAKCMYRIYRDTRFAKDKTPYKTHVGALIWRNGTEKNDAAAYYFAVSPEAVEIGAGLYTCEPDALRAVREHIAADTSAFRATFESRKVKTLMGELYGESTTRVPKGFDPAHPGAELLKRKRYFLYKELEPALAMSSKIVKEIVTRFEAMAPFVEFLNRPLLAQKNKKKRDEEFFR